MAAQISFERPFKHVFQDPNWAKKGLMGALISLSCIVLIGIPVLAGYSKRLFLAVSKDENAPIPEIDFGKDLGEGLGLVGLGLVYGIAFSIVSGILGFIPLLGKLVIFALWLAMMVVMPVAMMRYMATGQFAAAFDFKAIIDFIKGNLTNLLLMLAIFIVVYVAVPFGGIACGVGALFTGFLGGLVCTITMADVWRLAQQGEASPVAAPPSNDAPPAP
ncbi:MAG: DUF4013 domain-containing protein [Myxococcales bacterium]